MSILPGIGGCTTAEDESTPRYSFSPDDDVGRRRRWSSDRISPGVRKIGSSRHPGRGSCSSTCYRPKIAASSRIPGVAPSYSAGHASVSPWENVLCCCWLGIIFLAGLPHLSSYCCHAASTAAQTSSGPYGSEAIRPGSIINRSTLPEAFGRNDDDDDNALRHGHKRHPPISADDGSSSPSSGSGASAEPSTQLDDGDLVVMNDGGGGAGPPSGASVEEEYGGEDATTVADPLCAADANPFADCLPSNTRTLKHTRKGTKQHIGICLKFHQGLRCVTQYAERCFPPGTSDFLIPLNRSYTKSCSHLRGGTEIIGDRCYAELKPRWDQCVRTIRIRATFDVTGGGGGGNGRKLGKINADLDPTSSNNFDGNNGVLNATALARAESRYLTHNGAHEEEEEEEDIVTENIAGSGKTQFAFKDTGNRCCDRYRALKCVYDAVRTVGVCSPAALVRTIRATDLMSRDYLPHNCLKTDPSNCYFPPPSSSSSSAPSSSAAPRSPRNPVLPFFMQSCWKKSSADDATAAENGWILPGGSSSMSLLLPWCAVCLCWLMTGRRVSTGTTENNAGKRRVGRTSPSTVEKGIPRSRDPPPRAPVVRYSPVSLAARSSSGIFAWDPASCSR